MKKTFSPDLNYSGGKWQRRNIFSCFHFDRKFDRLSTQSVQLSPEYNTKLYPLNKEFWRV